MINRRSFFKSIGAAVLGTAIALRLPDSIVARVPIIANGISFHKLLKAFHLECKGIKEPNVILLSENRFRNTREQFLQYNGLSGRINHDWKDMPRETEDEFLFMGAIVAPSHIVSDDDVILLGGASKRAKIKIDEIDMSRDRRSDILKRKYSDIINGKVDYKNTGRSRISDIQREKDV